MAFERLGHYLGQYTTLLVAYSDRDCLDKLVSHGLSADRLPVSFGGTWTGCQPWRTGVDTDHVLPPIDPDLPCLVRNALWSYNQTLSRGSMDSRQSSSSFNEERDQFNKPRKSVASLGIKTDEDKAKKRKKNQEYAQRKRSKEKIEVEVLQGQCLALNRENSCLNQEHHHLQQLIQAANDMVQGNQSSNK
jgi:Basic region leucine zipper